MFRLIFLPFWVLFLLVTRRLIGCSMPGFGQGGTQAKVLITEARFNSLINNGGSMGGPLVVNATLTANSVNPQNQHRANLSWTPNTHLGGSSGTWEGGAQARINDLIDQLSAASDRCDYLNSQLINANVAVN